jgi:hypothetical protein
MSRRLAAALGCAAMAAPLASDSASAAGSCDRVASPAGSNKAAGTVRRPYRTAQKLIDSLSPGETGCLRAGTYAQAGLSFSHGGRSGAPLTLTSYPGERATVSGGTVEIPSGSNHVTIGRLNIDGSAVADATIFVLSFDVVIKDSDITNRNAGTQCLILGGNGWGGASGRVTIRRNRIHNCGRFSTGDQEHAIYFENTTETRVIESEFWGTAGFAIHLYPNARRTLVAHNVIDGNRYGVIVAGDDHYASSNNTIAYNLITNTSLGYNLGSWWGGAIGSANHAHHNCVYNGQQGDVGFRNGLTVVNTVKADPLYRDRANHDYRLSATSRCLAAVGYDTAAVLARRAAGRRAPQARLRTRVRASVRDPRVALEAVRTLGEP